MAYVKRETGYWHYSKLRGVFGYACSVCHTKFRDDKYDHIEQYKFCPACGSKLIEVRGGIESS